MQGGSIIITAHPLSLLYQGQYYTDRKETYPVENYHKDRARGMYSNIWSDTNFSEHTTQRGDLMGKT